MREITLKCYLVIDSRRLRHLSAKQIQMKWMTVPDFEVEVKIISKTSNFTQERRSHHQATKIKFGKGKNIEHPSKVEEFFNKKNHVNTMFLLADADGAK